MAESSMMIIKLHMLSEFFFHRQFVKFGLNFKCMFTYSKLINHNKIQDESAS